MPANGSPLSPRDAGAEGAETGGVFSELDVCMRCASPSAQYCPVTGLPHSADSLPQPGEPVRVLRWVPLKQSLAEFDQNPAAHLDNVASVWGLESDTVVLLSKAPIHLVLVSPNRQLQCAGQYELSCHPRSEAPQLYNGRPFWQQRLSLVEMDSGMSPKLLFMSEVDKRWVVADTLDDLMFHLCAENHDADLPISVRNWASNEDAGWTPDEEVAVTTADARPALEGKNLLYVEVEAVVEFTHLADAGEEEAHPIPPSQTMLPGRPATQVRTEYHLEQRVAVRDKDDTRWLLGTVVGIRDNVPLVRPDGHLIQWRHKYVWDEIAPITAPPAGEVGLDVAINGEYLAPDQQGTYFTCRVVGVSDDGQTCDCYVTRDGSLWQNVRTANLIHKQSLRADFARWRGLADDTWEDILEKYTGVSINFEYRMGDRVMVRDSDSETWMHGRVTGFSSQVISASLPLEDGTVQQKDMYSPLVRPDAWAENRTAYPWKQIRKLQEQEYLDPLVGGKRALIVSAVYQGTAMELGGNPHAKRRSTKQGATHAAYNLALTLTDIGFGAEIRLVTDTKESKCLPTKKNIVDGLDWLRRGAEKGDSLLLVFIGRAKTAKNDEAGVEPGLYPLDYVSEGLLTDDELHRSFFALIPEGVKLTCVFDTSSPSSLFALPQSVVGERHGLSFTSPASVIPSFRIPCLLNILSLTRDSVIDFAPGWSFCGILTDTLCSLLTVDREPTVNELIFQLGVDLDDVNLFPQYSTNAFEKAGGVMQKQFCFGSYPTRPRQFPPLALASIDLRACGISEANGTYQLIQRNVSDEFLVGEKGQQDLTPDESGNHVYTNYRTRSPYWAKIGDHAFQIRWHDMRWWVLRDIYGELKFLYKSDEGHLYPPVESVSWSAVDAPLPVPVFEAKYGPEAAAASAPGEEYPAVLTEPITLGLVQYPIGEEVTATVASRDMYTVKVSDGSVVHWVHESKLNVKKSDPQFEIGDLVACKDAPGEDWLIGKVVKFSKTRRPYVRPQSSSAVPWHREGGYIFKIVEKVEVGVKFEGKDVTGRWFPITLTMDNGDGTFQADVYGSSGGVKRWQSVHPQNMRRPRMHEVGGTSLRKEAERWMTGTDTTQDPDYGFDHTTLSEGDAVRIRDSLLEPWLEGEVKGFDSKGFPLVTPKGWSRGPYMWRVLEAVDPAPEPEEDGDEPWEGLEKSIRLSAPRHTLMCPRRHVRCVRFTPLKLRDADSDHVAIGCLQLLASPVYELPNPTFKLSKEYTGGKVLPDFGPENAGIISHSCWKCPMPASIVFQLTHPSALYGYRLQTPAGESPDLDPICWRLEVADGVDSGWILWDEVGPEEGAGWETHLPVVRLQWSPQLRPETQWFEGSHFFQKPCQSSRCAPQQDLVGTYTLRDRKGGAVRGQPVYCKDGGACIHLSAHNTWVVSASEADMLSGSGATLLRSPDTSAHCYKGLQWEMYIVEDGKQSWQVDPHVTVEPFVDEQVI